MMARLCEGYYKDAGIVMNGRKDMLHRSCRSVTTVRRYLFPGCCYSKSGDRLLSSEVVYNINSGSRL